MSTQRITRTEKLEIRLTPECKDAVSARAEDRGLSMSAYIHGLILNDLYGKPRRTRKNA